MKEPYELCSNCGKPFPRVSGNYILAIYCPECRKAEMERHVNAKSPIYPIMDAINMEIEKTIELINEAQQELVSVKEIMEGLKMLFRGVVIVTDPETDKIVAKERTTELYKTRLKAQESAMELMKSIPNDKYGENVLWEPTWEDSDYKDPTDFDRFTSLMDEFRLPYKLEEEETVKQVIFFDSYSQLSSHYMFTSDGRFLYSYMKKGASGWRVKFVNKLVEED